jgi:hypothetical protein
VAAQIALTGSGFGATKGSGTVKLQNVYATSIVNWSDKQIVATVPSGATPGYLFVTQSGINSNKVAFTMLPPTLLSMSATSVLPGMQVTFTGSGFGASQGTGGGVTFNNKLAASIVSWSDTSVAATVASGTLGGMAFVSQNGVRSNGLSFTMVPPNLLSMSATSVLPGMQVTFTGSGFGATQGTAGGVTFNNKLAASIVNWSDTSVTATVASGTLGGLAYVFQNGVRSNGLSFTMVPPNLGSMSSYILSAGVQVTFTGSGFGATQGVGGVTFNNQSAASIVSWSDTSVVATVASGTTGGLAYVSQNGVRSNGLSFTMTP